MTVALVRYRFWAELVQHVDNPSVARRPLTGVRLKSRETQIEVTRCLLNSHLTFRRQR